MEKSKRFFYDAIEKVDYINYELSSRVELFQGDITTLQADIIVNSADEYMEGGTGLSKIIHEKCGKSLLKYLKKKYVRINVGSIVKSPGYKLKCKKIIHAVGPSGEENEDVLCNIYIQCLDYCCNKNFKSIVFPCISAGARCFRKEKACICAIKTVQRWLFKYYKIWEGKIIFCCFNEEDTKLYQKYFTLYFPTEKGPILRPFTDDENKIIYNLKECEKEMKKYYEYEEFHAKSYEEALQKIKDEIPKNCPEVPEYPNSLPEKFVPLNIPDIVKLPSNLRQSIIYLIYGQAVGDAVGLSTEFLSKEIAYHYYGISQINYDHYYFDRHRMKWMDKNYICNDWTDDTDQCLLILDSLVHNNCEVDIKDFAKRCKFWINFGFVELGDIAGCGIGQNFGNIVSNKNFIEDPLGTSEALWRKGNCQGAANGCVMRTSIVAIPYFWDENKILENAKLFSKVTHFDPRCTASVVTVVSILGKLLNDRNDIENIINESIEIGKKELNNEEHINTYLKYVNAKTYDDLELNIQIGFTFKPMGCSILCLKMAKKLVDEEKLKNSKIFEILIEDIAREAGDADTNGAVVGAVLGCYLKDIPERWMKLRNIKWLQERINRLLKFYQLEPIPV